MPGRFGTWMHRGLVAVVLVALVGGVAAAALVPALGLLATGSGQAVANGGGSTSTGRSGAGPAVTGAGAAGVGDAAGGAAGAHDTVHVAAARRFDPAGSGPAGNGVPATEATARPSPPTAPPLILAVPVLTYHQVSAAAPAGEYVIRPPLFESQLKALADRGWHTITALDLGILLATRRAAAAHTFVVSIDDGWRDGMTVALPILERYGFVATYFIVPGLIGTPAYLDWDQVRTLASHGMEIGNHTRDHPHLTELSADDAAAEVADAQRAIAVELGDGADTFAYPFGAYNDAAVRAVEQAGLLMAFTTQTGTTASWPTRLTTPRIHVGATMTVDQLLRAMGAAR